MCLPRTFFIITLSTILVGIMGCASKRLRFKDAEPVRYFNDIHSIPMPESVQTERFDYYATVLPSRPELKAQIIPTGQYALDVNSIDEVPASSWYIPRLGYETFSPEDLLFGPTELGPPRLPITVIRVRHPGHNPRFLVYDRRNIYYLIKMDPPGYPNIATNSSFIVNRLFWGFGYHVPEDHLFSFSNEDIKIDPESRIRSSELDSILTRVALPVQGSYKAVASRIIEGQPLGPISEKGIRKDDPNDLFPHQKRRVLRGLRVFCALTNMCDISTDNTLDMYVGEEGKGFVKHYLVDFDDAFGTHAAREKRLWAGYNQLFSLNDILKNLFTIGFRIEGWEKVKPSPWRSVGSFESTFFKAKDWKETHPFESIRNSQPADNYWAAKIVGALTREHFEILVEKSGYPEPGAKDYMIQTLMERRHKILKYFLGPVTPIELDHYDEGKLILKNMSKIFLKNESKDSLYVAHFYDGYDREISKPMQFVSHLAILNVAIDNTMIQKSNGYCRVDISIERDEETVAVPAQFHFRKKPNSRMRLVGVVH